MLDEHLGGPGQYDDPSGSPNTLSLPRGGAACEVRLVYSKKKKSLRAIEPGPAFDAATWTRIGQAIEISLFAGPIKVGRESSFSTLRVQGSWRGARSGVQIHPPPTDAPGATSVEAVAHPFVLEFPFRASDVMRLTLHRRARQHCRLTRLLNALLAGGTSFQAKRSAHCWALVHPDSDRETTGWLPKLRRFFLSLVRRPVTAPRPEIKWVHQFYFAELGKGVTNELSQPATTRLAEVDPGEYYMKVIDDRDGLQVPADLDDLICRYQQLSPVNRDKFDRATFWLDIASRQWGISVSSSFGSLVSAVESLTDRGTTHVLFCEQCNAERPHEAPGATERFRAIVETFAPGAAHEKRRKEMYDLRSGISHGSELMELDQDLAFGWDPLWWNEHELHDELWGLTRFVLRNWLRNPPAP